jgi:hypothetical protein
MQHDAVRIQSPYFVFTLQHEENTAHSADSHPPLYLAALTAFALPPLAAPAAAPAPAPVALFFAAAALFAPVAAPFLPLLLATCDKNWPHLDTLTVGYTEQKLQHCLTPDNSAGIPYTTPTQRTQRTPRRNYTSSRNTIATATTGTLPSTTRQLVHIIQHRPHTHQGGDVLGAAVLPLALALAVVHSQQRALLLGLLIQELVLIIAWREVDYRTEQE